MVDDDVEGRRYPADWRTGIAYLRASLVHDRDGLRVLLETAGAEELLAAVTAAAVFLGLDGDDVSEELELRLRWWLMRPGSLL